MISEKLHFPAMFRSVVEVSPNRYPIDNTTMKCLKLGNVICFNVACIWFSVYLSSLNLIFIFCQFNVYYGAS